MNLFNQLFNESQRIGHNQLYLCKKRPDSFSPLKSSQLALRAVFITVTVLALFPQNSFALTDQERAQQQDIQAKQRIESERRDLIRQKEAEEIRNIGKAKEKAAQVKESQEVADDKTCRIIKEFKILGNSEIYSWTLNRKFIKPLQNLASKRENPSCFTKADLGKLHNQISNYYIKQGYVLARVYFDGSEVNKGIVKIIIEEGKLEKLEIHDNSKLNNALPFRRSTEKFFAFPSLWQKSSPLFKGEVVAFASEASKLRDEGGEVINLRDVEQGIEQMNRLGSNSAKMAMNPGSKAGYSSIVIENQIGHQANISFSTDNSGQRNTGRIKRKAALNYDNFFGINDNLYLNYSESSGTPLFGSSKGFNNEIGTNDNSNTRFSKSFYSSISVPFGY